MIVITEKMRSKSKKQFQPGVKIGFSCNNIKQLLKKKLKLCISYLKYGIALYCTQQSEKGLTLKAYFIII